MLAAKQPAKQHRRQQHVQKHRNNANPALAT